MREPVCSRKSAGGQARSQSIAGGLQAVVLALAGCGGTSVPAAVTPVDGGMTFVDVTHVTAMPDVPAAVDAAIGCSAGQQMCQTGCTTLATDPGHCGSCVHACPTGQTCVSGTCSTGTARAAVAGGPCASDAECGGHACDLTVAGGFCSWACAETGGVMESTACGGGPATCLAAGDTDPETFCTRGCTPSAVGEAAGGCRPGMVCTGFWFTHGSAMPDQPGCFPHCRIDADCGAAAPHCNPRTGSCHALAPAPGLLPDGAPCDPTGATVCHGLCFHVGVGVSQGICGSLLDVTTGSTCPDSPSVIQPRGPAGDNLAYCVFRTCAVPSDCPGGLTCTVQPGSSARVCTYP